MNNGDVVPLDLVDADLEIVENSRKRRRTNQDLPFHSPSPLTEASHEDLPEWHRDEKYYFEDGNIVILAGLELFRVHRSVLSCHSVVLRDMFTVPQPEPTDIEMEDECPLVRLQDHPRVIRWMLEVMYCGLDSNFLDPFKPCSLPKVCALLEIGQKYDVPQIRQNALHRFKLLFPCKLHNWKPHSMRLATARVVLADSCQRAQLAKVVEVLRIHGEPEALRLLPLVFYAYCQLSHQDDDEIHPDCQDLAQQDKQICRKAIRQLNAHQLATYSVFSHPDIRETCENYLRCDSIRLRLTHDLLKSRMLSPPCALENMATWCSSQKDWKQLCKPCSKKILSDLEKRRQGVWDDLGHIFNEPNWLEANDPQQ